MRADNRRHVSPVSVYLKYWATGKSEQFSFCQLWGLRLSFLVRQNRMKRSYRLSRDTSCMTLSLNTKWQFKTEVSRTMERVRFVDPCCLNSWRLTSIRGTHNNLYRCQQVLHKHNQMFHVWTLKLRRFWYTEDNRSNVARDSETSARIWHIIWCYIPQDNLSA
jgi:hypothetical protein